MAFAQTNARIALMISELPAVYLDLTQIRRALRPRSGRVKRKASADEWRHHRTMLGLLGEFGAIGPTCEAGAGADPSSTPITDRIAIRIISPWQTRFMFVGIANISTT